MKVLMGLKQFKMFCKCILLPGVENRAVLNLVSLFLSLFISSVLFLKYAKYLENHSIEGVRHVYMKACTVHLPKKPTVHLLWSAFEEQQGRLNCLPFI